ncbi:ParB/RepB/Spo0J family partition protein [Cupriavidus metallidurans]|uniref:ParB/RepB/Spo0J family partition protein n=1 Tax=Cupriavidus metallidurans TaxID=119219 RepID=UPI001CCE8128|nr:ParB/RepB/Spo0J family partition protein [Cupriavidus metallidurans]UBM12777.1 ParB/RepB/Spo0J family partition protein [Cupriavidus metallidurans]
MGKLTIVDMHPSALRPNPWNTNVVSPENEKKIDASLDRFGGFFKPIIARETDSGLEILAGEHRWGSAVRKGYESVPVLNLGPIDDQRAKEISLVDNGRYGEDDLTGLSALLSELGDAQEIMGFLPYTEADMNQFFSASSINLEDLGGAPDDKPIDLEALSGGPGTQVLRFKTPIEDASWITTLLEGVAKRQGYTDDDSMTNAGNALVHVLNEFRSK